MKPRKKKLNVGNTDRHFNINLVNLEAEEKPVLVTDKNRDDIKSEMEVLRRKSRRLRVNNETSYLMDYDRSMDDALFASLCEHGGCIKFRSDTVIPYYVTKQLANNPSSGAIYKMRYPFSVDEQHNVELSFMSTETSVEVDIKLPEDGPWELVFALSCLKTNLDNVYINFPLVTRDELVSNYEHYYEQVAEGYSLKAEYRYQFFKYIQTSLSIWKMNIYLNCESQAVYDEMNSFVQADIKKRSTSKG